MINSIDRFTLESFDILNTECINSFVPNGWSLCHYINSDSINSESTSDGQLIKCDVFSHANTSTFHCRNTVTK